MQIRPAQLDDAAAIAEIHVRTWQAAYTGIVPADYLASLSIEKHAARWHECIVIGKPQLLVATQGGRMLGWVAFGPSRDQDARPDAAAEIWAIYVSASHWGRSVGRGLWQHALERMRQQGFTSVSLWVFPENVRATAFYRALGFDAEPSSAKQFTLGGSQLNEVRYARSITE